MSDYSTSVGDLAELLHGAFTILQSAQGTEAASWRERFHEFEAALDGNRHLMKEQVGLAVGAASMCWSTPEGAGEFDSTRATEIVDNLMWSIDAYADSLPLIRHLNQLSLRSDDPVEILSQAFYEVSARLGESLGDHSWESAPDDIKNVIRQTVDQLVGAGLISAPPVKYTVEDGNRIHGSLQREFERAMNDMGLTKKEDVTLEDPVRPPDIPESYLPVSVPRVGSLPPDIPMPAGIRAENCGHPEHIEAGVDCRVQEVHDVDSCS